MCNGSDMYKKANFQNKRIKKQTGKGKSERLQVFVSISSYIILTRKLIIITFGVFWEYECQHAFRNPYYQYFFYTHTKYCYHFSRRKFI